jgi:hypothetical protein
VSLLRDERSKLEIGSSEPADPNESSESVSSKTKIQVDEKRLTKLPHHIVFVKRNRKNQQQKFNNWKLKVKWLI